MELIEGGVEGVVSEVTGIQLRELTMITQLVNGHLISASVGLCRIGCDTGRV